MSSIERVGPHSVATRLRSRRWSPPLGTWGATRLGIGALASGLIAFVVSGAFGYYVENAFIDDGPTPFDSSIEHWFTHHRTPGWTTLMHGVTWLAGGVMLGLVVGALALFVLVYHRRVLLALYLGVAVVGVATMSVVLKEGFARNRPPAIDHVVSALGPSYPSFHSAFAATTYIAIAVTVSVLARQRIARICAWTLAVLIIVAVGISRAYLGVHWATDVLGGWLLGGLWILGLSLTFRPALRRSGGDANLDAEQPDIIG